MYAGVDMATGCRDTTMRWPHLRRCTCCRRSFCSRLHRCVLRPHIGARRRFRRRCAARHAPPVLLSQRELRPQRRPRLFCSPGAVRGARALRDAPVLRGVAVRAQVHRHCAQRGEVAHVHRGGGAPLMHLLPLDLRRTSAGWLVRRADELSDSCQPPIMTGPQFQHIAVAVFLLC